MSTTECLTAYGCFFPFMLPGIITSYFIKSELLVWFIVELHICLPKYFLSLSQVIWSSCWTIHQWTFGVSTFFCLRIAVSSLLNVAHFFISSRHSDSGGLSAEDVKSDSNKCMKMGLGHPCMYARMQVCMDGCIHFLVYGLTECLKKRAHVSCNESKSNRARRMHFIGYRAKGWVVYRLKFRVSNSSGMP